MSYYCSIEYVTTLLPTNMVIGTTPQTQSTLQVTGGRESITLPRARELIALAGQMIDSKLSPVYVTPLKRTKLVDTPLTKACAKGSGSIFVRDGDQFSVGSQVRLSYRGTTDSYSISALYDDVPNISRIDVSPVLARDYSPSDGWMVSLVDYPPPIPLICARITVSMIIDRMFVAEQTPEAVSQYGTEQKNLAGVDVDSILQGVVRLHGQDHQGTRFARNSVRNAVATPALNFQPAGVTKG